MIERISFDVDGTLVDEDYNTLIWQKGLPELIAKKRKINFLEAFEIAQSEYDRVGNHNLLWYDLQYWLDYFEIGIQYQELLQKYENQIKIFPETITVLKKLSKKYPLICITSMPREFLRPKIKKIEKYFQSTFSAISDYKQLKDKTVYTKICQQLKVIPSSVIHIGDHEYSDYSEAKKAGMQALLINRSGQDSQKNHQKHIINDLSEIEPRLNLK